MKLLLLILSFSLYSLACVGLGFLAFNFFFKFSKKKLTITAGTEFATDFILGQGILASIWLGLALLKIFTLPIIIGVLFLCGFAGFYLFKLRGKQLFQQGLMIWRDFLTETWSWKVVIALIVLTCLLWITSIGRSVIGDGSAFYFALPKVIAASQQLVPLPGYEGFMFIGLQGEMHFAALMALGSPEAAQLFSWPTILAGSILLLALGRQIGLGRRGQWISLTIIFTSSSVMWLSGDGKTDLFGAALGLAAYYWVMQINHEEHIIAPFLTGLLAGFALVAKLTYVFVLIPGVFLLFCWGFREIILIRENWKSTIGKMLKSGLVILLGVTLALIPHLVKNGLLVHNVFAPFGTDAVGQGWFTAETIKRIVLTYPFALTFGRYWGQYGGISLLILAFLPLAFFLPKPKPILKSPLFAVTISALISLLIWIILRPSDLAPRYIFPSLFLFVLLPAKAAEYVSQYEPKPRLLSLAIIISILMTLMANIIYFKPLIFFTRITLLHLLNKLPECGREESQYYPDICPAMSAINNDSTLGDRVYLSSYYRYWFRPDIIQCLNASSEEPYMLSLDTPPEIYWENIQLNGFKYFLYDQSILGDINENQVFTDLPSWVKLTTLYQGENAMAFRIDVSNPPMKAIKECRQVNPPAWEVVTTTD